MCPLGSYRSEWVPAEAADACNSCGEGVFGSLSDSLEVYDPITEKMSLIEVQTEPEGCCKYTSDMLLQGLCCIWT
jgi:hypothetical protein